MKSLKYSLGLVVLLVISGAGVVRAQSDEGEGDGREASAVAARQLASRNPLVRQSAAEELASIVATDQRRLLEGYRLQEKNARVRLALDWALYRVGKTEALFEVVRALDSARSEQAARYLDGLESPEPLYFFLERMNGNTQVKLLLVLAKVGDAGTLDRLKTYSESYDPKIAEAARLAAQEIEQRLGEAPAEQTTRPRQVEADETTPQN